MIYICEYDHLAEDGNLRERGKALLLRFSEKDLTGVRWQRLRERILARALLETALWQEYRLTLGALDLQTDAHGKPYSGAYPELFFNISHCAHVCVCAVGDSRIGVDAEKHFPWRENLAAKICHPDEWARLQALGADQRERQLQDLWPLKESFVKWHGQGLSYGMNRVSFAAQLPFAQMAPCRDAKERETVLSQEIFTKHVDEASDKATRAAELHFLLRREAQYTLAVCSEKLPERIIYRKECELVR